MNAVDLLTEQHREIDRLFERFDAAKRQTGREAIFDELAAKLVAHDEIERDLFYPACERVVGRSEPLVESIVEHGLIEFTLFRADCQRGTDSFECLVGVLEELVRYHVGEEEAELLEEAARQMGEDMLDALGKAMASRHALVLARDPTVAMRKNVERLIAVRPLARPRARKTKLVRVGSSMKARPRSTQALRRSP